MKKKDTKKRDRPQPQDDAAPEGQDPIAQLQAERDDLLERLQRVSADYSNYQKRVRKDISQATAFANEELIKALLGVLDDIERALDATRENHNEDDPLLSGMLLVHNNALATLEKFGLAAIEAEGTPFDPDRHSAMMEEPTDEVPPQTVLKQLQRGYLLKGRTIRPASVIVSAEPQPPADGDQ